jgi:hypothetical protein
MMHNNLNLSRETDSGICDRHPDKTSAVKAAFEQKSAHKPHHYIDRHGKCKFYPLRHVDKALYYRKYDKAQKRRKMHNTYCYHRTFDFSPHKNALHTSYICAKGGNYSYMKFIRDYSSQLLTVLGNGITSRILPMPVRYITHLSKPSPKPACLAEPYFLKSR